MQVMKQAGEGSTWRDGSARLKAQLCSTEASSQEEGGPACPVRRILNH